MNRNAEKGQVLLIVVLIMVIALTVGLSLAARSLINLRNTNAQADSQKAFQAAEAGVEIALQKPFGNTDQTIYSTSNAHTMSNQAKIENLNIHYLTGSSIVLNNADPIAQDQGIDLWLTNYSGTPWSGKLTVYWGNQAGCSDAALEAIVISGSSPTDPNATITRYGVDPCGSIDTSKDRIGQNHFAPAQVGAAVNGITYNFATAITITNGIIVRLIPLYASTPIAVVGQDVNGNPLSLPVQGRLITSLGAYGATQRQVSFFQGYPLLPSEFFYSIFEQ